MNKKMSKRQQDIKSKLMAAIAMLLVSSIMMVSTTYAWFTLSTAPEVTGISTSVGANGNLEMALLPTDGNVESIDSNVGDSMASKDATVSNITWGNLVDVSDASYGLNQISLYPSKLNAATMDADELNPTVLGDAFLQTPAYGADGRVSELKADTVTSTYAVANTSFPQNEEYGVRAVGTAAGMTDRQLAYRNNRGTASTAMAQAKNTASQSLNVNGASLGSIVMKKATDGDSAKYTEADLQSLFGITEDLLGTDDKTGVLQYIEKAYKNYVIAYGASAAMAATYTTTDNGDGTTTQTQTGGMNDTQFMGFANSVEACATLTDVLSLLSTNGISVSGLDGAVSALNTTKATVQQAQDELKDLLENIPEGGYDWSDINTTLYLLADIDAMTVNGYTANEVKDNLGALVSDVSSGKGVTVTIASGGGVYADVADHCGDYTAAVKLENVSYGDINLGTMDAKMATASSMTAANNTPALPYDMNYLVVLGTSVTGAGAPSSQGGQTMPITDFYGYVIDLAFRTNAAESKLLLQTTPVDRIYSDNKDANAETMGHGSTMTFTTTNAGFTQDQMINLMEAIRIVFFDLDKNVLATAKLGSYAKDGGGETVTADIYLYENKGTTVQYTEVTQADDGTYPDATHVRYSVYVESQTGATHIADASAVDGYREAVGDEVATHVFSHYDYRTPNAGETATYKAESVPGGAQLIVDQTKAEICALTQNQAKAVSVLVYLDGENITNADVASSMASSMTGSMNLQFASSANLVPMNYTPLMTQSTSTETTAATTAAGN